MNSRLKSFALAASLALGMPSHAMFAQPSLMPTERLLERANAHLQAKPADAKAHYTLGRIHYLAFYNRASTAAAFGQAEVDDLPKIAPYWTEGPGLHLHHARASEASMRAMKKFGVKSRSEIPPEKIRDFHLEKLKQMQELKKEGWKPKPVKPDVAAEHATLALKAFDKAISLEPENPLYLLGRASLLEQAKGFHLREKLKNADPILSKITAEQIREGYYRAFATGLEDALKLQGRPITGLRSIASYEAGTAYARLSGKDGKNLSESEKTRFTKVKENLAKLNQLRRTAITPIIFSLRKEAKLGDLLERGKHVRFDLDGDGVAEEWPWVNRDTALLVWDPARRGRILSGRQLFGNYTWQIPFENGYAALAMLDQDGNKRLAGAELDGIRLWFDHDGDGVSDPGEVCDLSDLEIESIATSGRKLPGSSDWMSPEGVRLSSGETLASWDWVPVK